MEGVLTESESSFIYFSSTIITVRDLLVDGFDVDDDGGTCAKRGFGQRIQMHRKEGSALPKKLIDRSEEGRSPVP